MRALTVVPGRAGSGALSDVPEPDRDEGDVLAVVAVVRTP